MRIAKSTVKIPKILSWLTHYTTKTSLIKQHMPSIRQWDWVHVKKINKYKSTVRPRAFLFKCPIYPNYNKVITVTLRTWESGAPGTAAHFAPVGEPSLLAITQENTEKKKKKRSTLIHMTLAGWVQVKTWACRLASAVAWISFNWNSWGLAERQRTVKLCPQKKHHNHVQG